MAMQTWFSEKENGWAWEDEKLSELMKPAEKIVAYYIDGFGYECVRCAMQYDGIYIHSNTYMNPPDYSDIPAMVPMYNWDSPGECGMSCDSCNETIESHPDTAPDACDECGQIYYDGKRIETPTFDRAIRQVTFYGAYGGENYSFLLECGHVMMNTGVTPQSPSWKVHCSECKQSYIQGLNRDCDDCGVPIHYLNWEEVDIRRQADIELIHDNCDAYPMPMPV